MRKPRTSALLVLVSALTMCLSAAASDLAFIRGFSWAQLAELSGTDLQQYSFFGSSAAMSGNTVVVGAPGYNNNGNYAPAALYVFQKPAGGWTNMTQIAELTASDNGLNGLVAIDGDTIVAGGSPAAYVFVKPAGGWVNATETAKLIGSASDCFGCTAAISGNTIVVGAPFAYVHNVFAWGVAYVFEKPASGWVTTSKYTAKLTSSTGADQTDFSLSLAMSGDTLLVGSSSFPGKAYVFAKPAHGWKNMTETATLTQGDLDDQFGLSVSIGGGTAVVGAIEQNYQHHGPGAAYVYVKPVDGWKSTSNFAAKLTSSDGKVDDWFGAAVGVYGNTVVAGAPYATVGANAQQGASYVFEKPASGWKSMTQTSKLTSSDGHSADDFGASVAAGPGGTVVIGAPQAYGDSGKSYVFGK
jgi:FG-GAP repeat